MASITIWVCDWCAEKKENHPLSASDDRHPAGWHYLENSDLLLCETCARVRVACYQLAEGIRRSDKREAATAEFLEIRNRIGLRVGIL